MQQAGITPLFQGTDVNLAAALQRSPGAGIWLAAANGESPEAYARRLAALAARYNPSVVVPDVEFVGKGYQGSAGWNWNDAFVRAYRALLPNQRTALTVMPNQSDFNYGAYLRSGVSSFLPQSYGATYATQFDPRGVIDTLVRSGVPANMIQPVLAPGQSYGGPSSYYALDDYSTLPAGGGGASPGGVGTLAAALQAAQQPSGRSRDAAILSAFRRATAQYAQKVTQQQARR